MRTRVSMAIAVVVACLVAGSHLAGLGAHRRSVAAEAARAAGVVPSASAPVAAQTRSRPVLPPALLRPAPVTVTATGFWSWALIDRRTGEITGSPNFAVPNVTASMIKAWLAADYLRRAGESGRTPNTATMHQLRIMIRNSDNTAASAFWRMLGRSATIHRLIAICGLTDSRPYIDWAHTLVSARDAARMAVCIGDGRAAGAQWTEWVLAEMRAVRPTGRFGIVAALPPVHAAATAIKNGWVARRDGKWHVNCMAVGADWALAVMTVYPTAKGMSYGSTICRTVTQQLLAG